MKTQTLADLEAMQAKSLAKVRDLRAKGLNREEILLNSDYTKLRNKTADILKNIEEGKEAKSKEKQYLNGFEDTFSPMEKSKVIKTLTGEKKSIRGDFITIRDFILKVVNNEGAIVGETPEGKEGLLFPAAGTYMLEKDITKTAIKYAQYLLRRKIGG